MKTLLVDVMRAIIYLTVSPVLGKVLSFLTIILLLLALNEVSCLGFFFSKQVTSYGSSSAVYGILLLGQGFCSFRQ